MTSLTGRVEGRKDRSGDSGRDEDKNGARNGANHVEEIDSEVLIEGE